MTMTATPDVALADRRRGLIYVLLAGTLWSTIGLGVRLMEEALVWQIVLYRSLSMSLFLYIVIQLRTGKSPFAHLRVAGWPMVFAAFTLMMAYVTGIYAIQTTTVANALLLFASAPFMAAVLGWIILKERVRPATWVAMLAAILGVGVMVRGDGADGHMLGNLAALASAFGFALFTLGLRWGKSVEMMPAIFISGLFGIVVMGGICLLTGVPLVMSTHDTGIALAMGVFQVGAGLVLYTLGSRSLPAVELTLLSMVEVVLAPFWVWLFLGETAGANTLLGGAILVAAIVGNAITGARRKPPPITSP